MINFTNFHEDWTQNVKFLLMIIFEREKFILTQLSFVF